MEDYNNSLKLYNKSLFNNSVILKLINSSEYDSIKEIRKVVSNCQWESKNEFVNVYNFDTKDFSENNELFFSGILFKTNVKIIDIFSSDMFFNIFYEGDTNMFNYGSSMYVESNGNKIYIGNVIYIDKKKITMSSSLKNIEINYIRDKIIFLNLEIYSVKNYNKSICIHLPIVKLIDNKWGFDCIVDKKTYENDNKMCFNLLDDINPANACGILSVGLIGAFIGKITFDTFQKKKKEYSVEDKKNLVEILKRLKEIKLNKDDYNNSSSENSIDSFSENSIDSFSENSIDSSSENKDELISKNSDKYIKNENIIKENKELLLNYSDDKENKDYLKQIKEEIYLSDTHNENILNNLNHLNNMQDSFKIYINNDIDIFEKQFEKINNESIDFEKQFENSVKKIFPSEKIDLKSENIKDKEIKKSDYYINLLNSF